MYVYHFSMLNIPWSLKQWLYFLHWVYLEFLKLKKYKTIINLGFLYLL